MSRASPPPGGGCTRWSGGCALIAEPSIFELGADAALAGRVGDALRPVRRQRPSAWARENIRLSAAETPEPGPYCDDYLPWLRDLLDLEYDEPHYRGMLGLKGSQIGWSVLQLVLACWAADTDGGPQLYMIGDAAQGKHFADERFLPIANSSPALAEKIATGAKTRRKLVDSIPIGGDARVDFAGAGTVAGFISRPYRRVVADEIQLILANFPAQYGDPVKLLEGRTARYRIRSWIALFGHPKVEGDRLDRLQNTITDLREWVWDCPHCAGAVRLSGMDQIHFDETDGREPTAAGAVLRCPCCGEVITDEQRKRAVWPPRLGGSGRFESRLSAAEAAGKTYIGIRVHGLCDPYKAVRGVAQGWLDCPGDEERQGYYNATLGWPYQKSSAAVTVRDIDELVEKSKGLKLLPGPGVRGGAKYIVVGSDVQAPKASPTYYAVPMAALSTGVVVVLDWWLVGGAASDAGLLDLCARFSVPVADASGARADRLGVSTLSIDDRFATGHVLDLARNTVYRELDGARVRVVPMGYQAKMTDDEIPWKKVTNERRLVDPARPHLGRLERYELRRHCWVDRVMRMMGEGRLLFLTPPDARQRAQLTSNVLQPKKQLHTWEHERDEWMLPKGLRDDWMQAICQGLAAMVILHRFDAIHELEMAAIDRERRPLPPREGRPTDWLGGVGDDWLG